MRSERPVACPTAQRGPERHDSASLRVTTAPLDSELDAFLIAALCVVLLRLQPARAACRGVPCRAPLVLMRRVDAVQVKLLRGSHCPPARLAKAVPLPQLMLAGNPTAACGALRLRHHVLPRPLVLLSYKLLVTITPSGWRWWGTCISMCAEGRGCWVDWGKR